MAKPDPCKIPTVKPILPYTLTPLQIINGARLKGAEARTNRKVLATFILAHQDEFDMSTWHGPAQRTTEDMNDSEFGLIREKIITQADARYACGTAHCIAGWCETLATNRKELFKHNVSDKEDGRPTYISAERIGQALLGLTCQQASHIFYTGDHAAIAQLQKWAKDTIEVPQ